MRFIEDACGEVTGHPRENTTRLDPRRVVWSYGCILWMCFGAALGSWLAPLGRHFGVGWADEGRDVPWQVVFHSGLRVFSVHVGFPRATDVIRQGLARSKVVLVGFP